MASDKWKNARSMLPPNVRVVEMSSNDSWFRDTGPSFVVSRNPSKFDTEPEVARIDWRFNSWGGLDGSCYSDWSLDVLVAKKILNIEMIPRFPQKIVLEGGSIHVDGKDYKWEITAYFRSRHEASMCKESEIWIPTDSK